MAKSPDFKEACNQDLNTDYMPPRADYMPPRNPKSVLYTVKTTISPDKKHTCLEMKSNINDMLVFFKKTWCYTMQLPLYLRKYIFIYL